MKPLKNLLFVALLATLAWNCQKDDAPGITETTNGGHPGARPSNVKVQLLSHPDLSGNEPLTEALDKLAPKNKGKDNYQGRFVYIDDHGLGVNTDHATYIENENGRHSYTFPVSRPEGSEHLENLVFAQQEDGTYNVFLIAYDLTEEQKMSLYDGEGLSIEPKVAHVSKIDVDLDELADKVLWDDGCSRLVRNEYHTNQDGGPWELTEGSQCQHENDPGYCTITYTYEIEEYGDCNSTGGDGSDDPSPGGDTPHPGGSGPGGGTGDTAPTADPMDAMIDNFFDSLAPEQSAYVNGNSMFRKQLYFFLQQNLDTEIGPDGGSNNMETYAFLYQAIDAKMGGGTVDFVDHLENYNFHAESAEILIFEQDYRNRMSNAEKSIFDGLSRFQQLDYLHSAYLAQTYAEIYYEDTVKVQYNGKGDAYRHCLWNALATAKLGENLTKQLTDAHEVPNLGQNNNQLEKTMDLHNNNVGRQIGKTSVFMLMMKVKFAVENGNTNYITPTNLNGTVINGVSQIKPTNQ